MKWNPSHNVYFMFRHDISLHDMNGHLDWKTPGGNPDPWQDKEDDNIALFDGYS